MEVLFEGAARDDIERAAEWYDRESPGLGTRYIEQIERISAVLSAFPEAFREVEPGVRRAFESVFSVHLYYTLETDHVRVLAVLNARQDIGTWKKRRA